MAGLVQRVIVEPDAKPSSLLPMRVSLENPDGSPYEGGGSAPGAATATQAGVVKMAASVAQVSEADAALAAGETPTKAEFDAAIELLNSLKATVNQVISAETSAGQMG